MKRKITAILVCMLIAIGSVFTVVSSTSVEKQILVTQNNSSKRGSTTLITELQGNRVIEVDSTGTIVWQKTGLTSPVDAERLANGNTLIAELGSNRVIEVDSGGNMVWNYTALNGPFDVERLTNGNTLISDTYNNHIIEVNSTGTIVWQKTGLNWPVDAERLTNGNTLIADFNNNRVIEVDNSGTIVWQFGINGPIDVERLANGNTLITEWIYGTRVIEVDNSGTIVWTYNTSTMKFDAERFANGNTLISEPFYGNSVIEVNSSGMIVWQKVGLNGPVDAERITNPPNAPTINGKTSGKAGKQYEYTFNAIDPDGDDIRYFIDWGDNNTEWTDFNASGTDVKVKHTWSNEGSYNITAKAQDIYYAEGPEGTLTVTIPRTKPANFKLNLLNWLFERYPNAFPVLRQLLSLK
jgi:hypothetical protein